MVKRRQRTKKTKKVNRPSVRIARPAVRPFQLRYHDAETGKETRISIGCRDEDEAQRQKAELEAKLLLGIDGKPKAKHGPEMSWEEFRVEYSRMIRLRGDRCAKDTDARLNVAERIVRPETLADMATKENLRYCQEQLLAGAEGRDSRPRSPFTVIATMSSVYGALNWACTEMEWIEFVPKVKNPRYRRCGTQKGDVSHHKNFSC